jgi:hypothetical protein
MNINCLTLVINKCSHSNVYTTNTLLLRLQNNAEAAFNLCQALATKIMEPELITGADARSLAGHPRGGKGIASFTRQWRPMPPPSKKAREQPLDEMPLGGSAGRIELFEINKIHVLKL